MSNKKETEYLIDQLQLKEKMAEEDVHYMPPRMEDREFHHACVVSKGTVVGAEEIVPKIVTSEPEPQSEEKTVNTEQTDVGVETREVVREKSLEPELNKPLVVVEAEGVREGGNADSGVEEELSIESISSEEPRHKLAEATKTDDTLATAWSLADSQLEGYNWADKLVFRT